MKEHIRLLHINDLHSHFQAYPKIKRFFEQQSQTQAEVLRLDLGDNVDKSHPLTAATAGQANVQLMNELGIDFATIGNNEGIGLSKDELNQLYNQADFQVIVNNLSDNSGRPSWAQSHLIYESKAGTKLAFLAYTFPYQLTYEPNGWQVDDALDKLREDLTRPDVAGADFRIVLSHLGIKIDEQIAREIADIDLIIGGHTHHVFESGDYLEGTYLAAAGRYGDYVGQIDLIFSDHKLDQIELEALATSQLPAEKSDQAFVQSLIQQGQDLLSQRKVASLARDLSVIEATDLVMEAMKAASQADLAILNSGIVLENLAAEVTQASLHQALPHQMRLVSFEVRQADLSAICDELFPKAELLANQSIRGMGFRGKQFGHLRTSGFTYKKGKIVYNGKVRSDEEPMTLVLVDQYYFAPYFDSIRSRQGQLLFPDLLRTVVEKYLKGRL